MPKKHNTIMQFHDELITWLIAETCLEQSGIEPTKELVNHLVARANYQYVNFQQFRKGVDGFGNNGRDYLYMMLGHWVKGRQWERHGMFPDVFKAHIAPKNEMPEKYWMENL